MAKRFLVAHLADYNKNLEFNANDFIAVIGNTGASFGVHAHIAAKEGATSIADFYRGSPGIENPDLNSFLDMSQYTVTLGWYNTSESPYSSSRPHLGVDIVKKDGSNKFIPKVATRIIRSGFDNDFGNYIIFEIRNTNTTPPKSNKIAVHSMMVEGTRMYYPHIDYTVINPATNDYAQHTTIVFDKATSWLDLNYLSRVNLPTNLMLDKNLTKWSGIQMNSSHGHVPARDEGFIYV